MIHCSFPAILIAPSCCKSEANPPIYARDVFVYTHRACTQHQIFAPLACKDGKNQPNQCRTPCKGPGVGGSRLSVWPCCPPGKLRNLGNHM